MTNPPLEEIRILDMSQVYAGPLAGRVLADMGAEVIRIESAVRSTRGGPQPQPGATYPNNEPGDKPYNRSAYYNELNRNKLAISLDLSKDKGKEIFKKLVNISDVIIENFSPRVMFNFGLDYPVLKQIKPEIIMVSISAYGQTGPYRNYVSFGRGIEAMTGLSQMTGYKNGQPLGPGIAYADATGGLHAAFAVLVALRHRGKTGEGQYIDLSLRESLAALLGEQILDYSMNKRIAEGKGNRDSTAIFQGCYRCQGDNKWIAIAFNSEKEWEAFCTITKNTDKIGKWKSADEMDKVIEQWTINHDPNKAMEILQNADIRAGVVLDASEINNNQHLHKRNFFESVTHPEAGTHDHAGIPWKFSVSPLQIRTPAPCFAQHNDYVFGELLGMSDQEIAELEAKGIASQIPLR